MGLGRDKKDTMEAAMMVMVEEMAMHVPVIEETCQQQSQECVNELK